MLSVKEIQYDNKQASQCLSRCQKAIKDIYGDKVPQSTKNKPIKLADKKTIKKVEVKKANIEKVLSEEVSNQEQIEALSSRLEVIKIEGNREYKSKSEAKSFVYAVSKFTQGISLYQKNEALCKSNIDLRLKVCQLYTNRALAWSQMGNIDEATEDANYVLENLDAKNAKALYRRAQGYKHVGNLEKAIEDLETLLEVDPENSNGKKDLEKFKLLLSDKNKENEINQVK